MNSRRKLQGLIWMQTKESIKLWGLFWWGHRFQIASFSPSTLGNSVFKKHRFQIAPLWRAFSNGSVFGDRFRRCSVDDSRIRSKTAPFSFENGLVWTGPNRPQSLIDSFVCIHISPCNFLLEFIYAFATNASWIMETINKHYYTSDSLWKIWLVENIQSIHNSLWAWKCNIRCRYCIYHVKFNVCLATKPLGVFSSETKWLNASFLFLRMNYVKNV